MPALHGKKFWNEVANHMEPVLGLFKPKPPIINIHGIHALQLPCQVENARTVTFWCSIIILINAVVLAVVGFLEFDIFGLVFAIFAVLYFIDYFCINLEGLLKHEFVLQYEDLSQNGTLEMNLRKISQQVSSVSIKDKDDAYLNKRAESVDGTPHHKTSHKSEAAQIRAQIKEIKDAKNKHEYTPEEKMNIQIKQTIGMMVGLPPTKVDDHDHKRHSKKHSRSGRHHHDGDEHVFKDGEIRDRFSNQEASGEENFTQKKSKSDDNILHKEANTFIVKPHHGKIRKSVPTKQARKSKAKQGKDGRDAAQQAFMDSDPRRRSTLDTPIPRNTEHSMSGNEHHRTSKKKRPKKESKHGIPPKDLALLMSFGEKG